MQKQAEPNFELAIDPETVRLFIVKAKAIGSGVRDDYQDGNEHEVEVVDGSRQGHHHDGLAEEEEEDLTERELRALIGDLNVDEAADLVALMWLGRGDFGIGEWSEAVADARQRNVRKTADYLLGMPQLAEWLEDGLEALGA